MTETVNARSKLGRAEAEELLKHASKVEITRGTKTVTYKLTGAGKTPRAEVVDNMLGRTGNLRAPVMRVGDRVYVGFPKTGFDDLRA